MRTRMYGGVRGRKTKVGGKSTFVFLLLDFLFEILKIIEAWLQLALLDLMDDFHYFVVHLGRAADLSAVVGNSSVDRIDFGELAFFDVLEHAGLEFGVLADGDRDDEE